MPSHPFIPIPSLTVVPCRLAANERPPSLQSQPRVALACTKAPVALQANGLVTYQQATADASGSHGLWPQNGGRTSSHRQSRRRTTDARSGNGALDPG